MIDHLDRITQFTNKEFKALDRNADGDIIELSTAFLWILPEMVSKLSEDDFSRLFEYEEEARHLMNEAIAEFSN